MVLILSFLLISCFSLVQLQESSITYSPTSSICAGDTLNITCYVYPEDDVELQLYALLYLCTRDLPYSQRFTIDSTIPGYLVTGDIPVKGNSARLKITIHSYQYSESGCDIYCQGEYADGHHADSGAVSTTPPLSGSPYAPTDLSISATLPSEDSCANFLISWSQPDRVNTIDRYYVYCDVHSYIEDSYWTELVATTADTRYIMYGSYIVTNHYSYYVIASNCGGKSTQSEYIRFSFEGNIENLTLSYDPTSRTLAVDWNLEIGKNTVLHYIRYVLYLRYNLTAGNFTHEYVVKYIFSQLSTATSYHTVLTYDLTLETPTSACLLVIEQCGQAIPPSWHKKTCTANTPSPITTLPTTFTTFTTLLLTLLLPLLLTLLHLLTLLPPQEQNQHQWLS